MSEHFPAPWHVDPLTASVYAIEVPKGPARVADMRGWGYLTGKGHGALALSQDEAIDIQRANAAFLVKAVNNHDALVEALKHAKARFECLAEDFRGDENNVNWAMCSVDAERMARALDPVGGKASD